jgi:hypothetical protein
VVPRPPVPLNFANVQNIQQNPMVHVIRPNNNAQIHHQNIQYPPVVFQQQQQQPDIIFIPQPQPLMVPQQPQPFAVPMDVSF